MLNLLWNLVLNFLRDEGLAPEPVKTTNHQAQLEALLRARDVPSAHRYYMAHPDNVSWDAAVMGARQ